MQYLPMCPHDLLKNCISTHTQSTYEMNKKNECTLSKRKLIEQQYNSNNNNVLSFVSPEKGLV